MPTFVSSIIHSIRSGHSTSSSSSSSSSSSVSIHPACRLGSLRLSSYRTPYRETAKRRRRDKRKEQETNKQRGTAPPPSPQSQLPFPIPAVDTDAIHYYFACRCCCQLPVANPISQQHHLLRPCPMVYRYPVSGRPSLVHDPKLPPQVSLPERSSHVFHAFHAFHASNASFSCSSTTRPLQRRRSLAFLHCQYEWGPEPLSGPGRSSHR